MDDQTLAKQIGTLVRRLRANSQLSQEEFAERCGVHRTYIGHVERGEKSISCETAAKLARAFDLTLGEFFVLVEHESRLKQH
jgi:transcriptional regulator with XRE-family HTH domain